MTYFCGTRRRSPCALGAQSPQALLFLFPSTPAPGIQDSHAGSWGGVGGRGILTKACLEQERELNRSRSLSRRQEQPPQWEGEASQQLSETRPGLFFFQFVGMWVDFSPFFLLSCSLPFPQRCGSLQICLSGGERQELIFFLGGVLVRDQGNKEGHVNLGGQETRTSLLTDLLG